MPTTADLERLQALLARLTPLSAKQRGELIAADDWNLLVGAIIEVGRAALAAEANTAVPPHDHTDQVSIGWLDSQLRNLVSSGGRDPAVETDFIKLRRDLGALSTRVDRVKTDIDDARLRVDRFATNDIVREAAVTRLDRKLLGAEDGRSDIADLRNTLRTMEVEVQRAVEVGTRLEANGQTIDVAGLVQRTEALEALRDRLKNPDGTDLSAATLEARLTALQSRVVTQDQLTDALHDVRGGGVAGPDLAALMETVRATSRETASASVDSLATVLRGEINRSLGTIEPTVSAAVDRATQGVLSELRETTRQQVETTFGELSPRLRDDITGFVNDRLADATAAMDARLATLQNRTAELVAGAVKEQLAGSLRTLDNRINDLKVSVDRLGDGVRRNDATLADLGQRFEVQRRDDATARSQLRSDLLDAVTASEGRTRAAITIAVDAERTNLRTEVDASVTAARRDLEAHLSQVAREAASTEISVLSNRLRADTTAIVRTEVDGHLGGFRNQFTSEVNAMNQQVAGLVANEVARATSNIPTLVSNEVEILRPEIGRAGSLDLQRPNG